MESDVIRLLLNMIEFDSLSGNEAELVSWLSDEVRGKNVSREVIGRNLILTVGCGEPRLLLNTHLDVVPPGEGWASDPFKPIIVNGSVIGRGANDAKGCAAAMLMAMLDLAAYDLRGSVVLALTCDEETGGEGLEKIGESLGVFGGAVVGEPTFNLPCFGIRGPVSIELVADGRGCHASRPEEGNNPVYPLARDLERLRKFTPPLDEHLGAATLAVTFVESGSFAGRNRIPDTARAIVDIRTTPTWDNEQAVHDAKLIASESNVRVRSDRFLPKQTASDSLIAAACARVLGAEARGEFRGLCDLAWVSCPGVILGPGNRSSHQVDEHVEISSVEDAVRIYREIVLSFMR